jgi:prepilin-type N-terminal cleavage/methylation domain-containing protein
MVKRFNAAAPRSDAGFTLIEVMIAMTILSVGLMSIAVAQLTAIKVTSRSKHLQDAMFLAREQMDTLEAITPDPDPAVASFFGTAKTLNDVDLQLGTDVEDATRYTRQTQITPGQPSPGLARVVVTVTWNNANSLSGTTQVQLGSVMRIN